MRSIKKARCAVRPHSRVQPDVALQCKEKLGARNMLTFQDVELARGSLRPRTLRLLSAAQPAPLKPACRSKRATCLQHGGVAGLLVLRGAAKVHGARDVGGAACKRGGSGKEHKESLQPCCAQPHEIRNWQDMPTMPKARALHVDEPPVLPTHSRTGPPSPAAAACWRPLCGRCRAGRDSG